MPFLNKDGFQMYYEVHSDIVPHDILLVHGNVASSLWWQPTIELFQKKAKTSEQPFKGRVIVADWRGSGRSSAPKTVEELAPENLAQDFLDLLDHLKIEKCHLVGHSAGGAISQFCLVKQSQRFGRVLLLNPVAASGLAEDEERRKRFQQMKADRDLLERSLQAAIYQADKSTSFFQEIVSDSMKLADLNWLGVLDQFALFDIRAQLSKVQNHVLVLFGEQDVVLPISGGQETADVLPNGKFVKMENAGHSCNLEDPERFFSHLYEFMYGEPTT